MWLTNLDSNFIPGTDLIKLQSFLKFKSTIAEQIFKVPSLFVSDGLSIPRFCWFFTGHPFQAKARRAAVLHDYLYRIGFNRYLADKVFKEALIADGFSKWKAFVFFAAVRVFGFTAWTRKKKHETVQI